MISDGQAVDLVRTALGVQPLGGARQGLTDSGNDVFRAVLPDQRTVAFRVSSHPAAFASTRRNLEILRGLGLPVAEVLGAGSTATGGSFILLSWIPGRDLQYELPRMSTEQMTRVAGAVTGCQKRVGTLPQGTGFGWAPIGEKAGAAMAATGPVAAGATPLDQLRGRLRGVREPVEPYLARVRPVCFLDDLTIKNVLVEGGALQGLIALDSVCYGDPLLAVGSTLTLIATEVGEAGRFYGEELIRCWNPEPDELRAIRFYAALWSIGLLSAAGDPQRARTLESIAEAMLRLAEGA